MKFLSTLLPVALLFAPAAVAADLPAGEAVLSRFITASGGAEAYAKVKTVVLSGTVEMAGHNISGPISIYQQGDKSYSVTELPGIGKIEEGCDGETAWENNALQGARIKDGAEKTATMRAGKVTLLSSWRDYYKSARTVAAETLDDKPVWKVELIPTEGAPELFYFDQKSALLVRMSQTLPTALGDIPVDVTLSDYRAVNGIQTPFNMVQKAMSQTLNMRFEKIAYNAPIEANRFALPPAVKALRDRPKQP
jgi:hypothetical protein